MKLRTILFAPLLILATSAFSQFADQKFWEETKEGDKVELNVVYCENEPFVYSEKGELKGIEVDILNYFVKWVEEEKGIKIKLVYQEPQTFEKLLKHIELGKKNTIGLGSVTVTEKRKERFSFTAPYLRNVSVLITNGGLPTVRSEEDLENLVNGYYAVTVKGSLHASHLNDLRNKYRANENTIRYVKDQNAVIREVANSARYYAYVDIINFWKYMKNSDKYVKVHKNANIRNEFFGLIFPNSSGWLNPFNEFMESGFGFTATKDYHEILEKHLGYEVIETVELD
ncbi:MAG: transporter substrate-binding domain-containing protein [Vicingaceae bacterium]